MRMIGTCRITLLVTGILLLTQDFTADAQTAKARYEILKLIRKDKFDLILPGAMRDNGFVMWIHVMRDRETSTRM